MKANANEESSSDLERNDKTVLNWKGHPIDTSDGNITFPKFLEMNVNFILGRIYTLDDYKRL